MKSHISDLIKLSIQQLQKSGDLPDNLVLDIVVDRTKDSKHGDFSCNIAMRLAKTVKQNPRKLAQDFVRMLPSSKYIEKTELAGPGFINFYLTTQALLNVVHEVVEQKSRFGSSLLGNKEKVQVEFVSANPTGPLHVGHGRGAAHGAVVANLLAEVGYDVSKEYYVNDAGRQMDILATSVWLRYLEQCGDSIVFPSNGYKGRYVVDIASELFAVYGADFSRLFVEIIKGVRADEASENPGGDKEAHIDDLINKAKALLGERDYRVIFDFGLNKIIEDIKQDLGEFGVVYDEWFSERSLVDSKVVDKALQRLLDHGCVYEKDGALWFRSSKFGDEKDRVVKRDNGQTTYFASDIAYHMNKLDRGFTRIIDVWGADHHGYVPRVRASLDAMDLDSNALEVLLVQFAILYRKGKKAQMSTRSGEFVTLRELRSEVGNDAARFFYVMRKCEQHLDFDLDLAKSQSNENPVFYVQYAHARICSVFREIADNEKDYIFDSSPALESIALLDNSHELSLLTCLARYPEIVESAAVNLEPHQIPHYLRDLANHFHSYYNAHKFIVDDLALRNARLLLISATRQVLSNGMSLIGVSAPEVM